MSEVEKGGKEAYFKAIRELRDSAPKILINIGVIVLIWAFTKYVFVPLSAEYALFGMPLPQLVSLIAMATVAILVLGIIRECLDLIDAGAAYLAYEIGAKQQAAEEEISRYRTGFRSIFYVMVVAALFALFKEFLNVMHPLLSALVLLLVSIWAIATLVRAGRAFSKLAEYYAEEWVKKLEARSSSEGEA